MLKTQLSMIVDLIKTADSKAGNLFKRILLVRYNCHVMEKTNEINVPLLLVHKIVYTV